MLDGLQKKLRRLGLGVVAGVFLLLYLAVGLYTARQLTAQYAESFHTAYTAAKRQLAGVENVSLTALSGVETTYGTTLFVWENGLALPLPYSTDPARNSIAAGLSSTLTDLRAGGAGEVNTPHARIDGFGDCRLGYYAETRENGSRVELVLLRANAGQAARLAGSWMFLGMAMLAAYLGLAFLFVRFIRRAFVPAYAAQKAQLEFLSLAGHELRTPVTVIQANAELLRGSAEAPPLDNILSETHRMGKLVEELILYSRLEVKNLPIHPVPIDPGASALECYGKFCPLFAAAGRRLTLDLPSEPLTFVRADPDRLAQILETLLSNANSHTPAGTSVTLGVREEGRQTAVFVRDDGNGVDAARAFAPFATSGSAQSGHLGVGLAIARELAVLQGGTLDAQNIAPHGALFTLRLPRDAAAIRG